MRRVNVSLETLSLLSPLVVCWVFFVLSLVVDTGPYRGVAVFLSVVYAILGCGYTIVAIRRWWRSR